MKSKLSSVEYLDCQAALFRESERERQVDRLRTVISVLLVASIMGWLVAFVVVVMG
jgi:hypothetical protein